MQFVAVPEGRSIVLSGSIAAQDVWYRRDLCRITRSRVAGSLPAGFRRSFTPRVAATRRLLGDWPRSVDAVMMRLTCAAVRLHSEDKSTLTTGEGDNINGLATDGSGRHDDREGVGSNDAPYRPEGGTVEFGR
jgi:hypothetical protein